MERLQKFLSRAGVASRRHAETMIVEGRVKVNGKVVTVLGTQVDPGKDLVLLDSKLVSVNPSRMYFLFYKPPGVVTTLSDPEGRPSVGDYAKDVGGRVFPIGRLDYDAEGALLLTDDGDLANKLMHPSHQVPRVYLAKVKGVPDEASLQKLVDGVRLEDGMAHAVQAQIFEKAERNTWVKIIVTEGRQHLVKRLFAAIGHPVVRLYRPAHAGLPVHGLRPGQLRALSNDEIRRVKAAADGDAQPEPRLTLPARRHGHAAPGFEPEEDTRPEGKRARGDEPTREPEPVEEEHEQELSMEPEESEALPAPVLVDTDTREARRAFAGRPSARGGEGRVEQRPGFKPRTGSIKGAPGAGPAGAAGPRRSVRDDRGPGLSTRGPRSEGGRDDFARGPRANGVRDFVAASDGGRPPRGDFAAKDGGRAPRGDRDFAGKRGDSSEGGPAPRGDRDFAAKRAPRGDFAEGRAPRGDRDFAAKRAPRGDFAAGGRAPRADRDFAAKRPREDFAGKREDGRAPRGDFAPKREGGRPKHEGGRAGFMARKNGGGRSEGGRAGFGGRSEGGRFGFSPRGGRSEGPRGGRDDRGGRGRPGARDERPERSEPRPGASKPFPGEKGFTGEKSFSSSNSGKRTEGAFGRGGREPSREGQRPTGRSRFGGAGGPQADGARGFADPASRKGERASGPRRTAGPGPGGAPRDFKPGGFKKAGFKKDGFKKGGPRPGGFKKGGGKGGPGGGGSSPRKPRGSW